MPNKSCRILIQSEYRIPCCYLFLILKQSIFLLSKFLSSNCGVFGGKSWSGAVLKYIFCMMAKKYRTSYVISRKIEIKWLVYTSLFILFLVLQSWILYQRPLIANLPGIFAEAEPKSDLGENLIEDASKAQDKIEQKCADCRLTSNSIEELIRKPRQMNSYGQVDDRIDLEKIKKAVCKELIIDSERESCRSFYFNHLSTIQKWKQAYSRMSFFDFVCIKELKYCCPRNSFGPKCIKCQQCGPNQHCHGDGSRTGNGECVCNEGYTGADCASCNQGYFLDKNSDFYLNDSSFKATCKPCHRSCLYCRQVGPLGCEVCRSGFSWIPGYGCSDIDECIRNKKICGENTFCVNTEGSYFCYGKLQGPKDNLY